LLILNSQISLKTLNCREGLRSYASNINATKEHGLAELEGPWYSDSNPEAYGETPQEAVSALFEPVVDLCERFASLKASIGAASIVPADGNDLEIEWHQWINSSGTHMTKIIDLQTGWSITSNLYAVGGLTKYQLNLLAQKVRECFAKRTVDAAGMMVADEQNKCHPGPPSANNDHSASGYLRHRKRTR
jgi:hypothetical protein